MFIYKMCRVCFVSVDVFNIKCIFQPQLGCSWLTRVCLHYHSNQHSFMYS